MVLRNVVVFGSTKFQIEKKDYMDLKFLKNHVIQIPTGIDDSSFKSDD